jgi:hypothetical protein
MRALKITFCMAGIYCLAMLVVHHYGYPQPIGFFSGILAAAVVINSGEGEDG